MIGRSRSRRLVTVLTLALAGCSDDSVTSDAAAAIDAVGGDAAPADTDIRSSGPQSWLPLCTSPADCAPDGSCLTLTSELSVCSEKVAEATSCLPPRTRASEQCCSTADCAAARCYNMYFREPFFCAVSGGGNTHYVCIADRCASDSDCPGGVCAPAGVAVDLDSGHFVRLPARTCIKASCRRDADCTAAPGGRCWLANFAYCCNPVDKPPAQLVCVYLDGCTSHTDCGEGNRCTVREGRTSCVPGTCLQAN